LEDQTVTLRERDSMKQVRISIVDLKKEITEHVALETLLRKL
jgi:glycyl-tRNA synthetase (class II)